MKPKPLSSLNHLTVPVAIYSPQRKSIAVLGHPLVPTARNYQGERTGACPPVCRGVVALRPCLALSRPDPAPYGAEAVDPLPNPPAQAHRSSSATDAISSGSPGLGVQGSRRGS